MASTDAKPVPQKNVAYRVTFPILDADGDLVTGATGLDSEISKDGGTFGDCTNEATEIATSSGVYYLDLTSTEMNADTVAIIVKTSSSGAKTTTLVMYPEEAGDIRVNVTQFGGSNGAFTSGRPEVNTTHAAGTAWNSGAIGANTLATDTITAAKIAADAIGASELAADAATEIGTAVWATAARTLTALDEDNTTLDLDATIRAAVGLAAANLDTQLGAIDDFIDTEVSAIKTKTDQLTFTTANRVDSQVFGMQAGTVTAAAVATDAIDADALAADAIAEINATVDTALADYDGPTHAELVAEINSVQADIAALENLSAAEVNAEVVDALAVDTYAEPGQGDPAATASLKDKIGFVYKAWRNRITQTNSQYSLYADDGSTVDQKAATSDDGTTFARTEISGGP